MTRGDQSTVHNTYRGVLPYMGYIGMCRCEGYGFQAVYSRIGYINQNIWVQNKVSFFRKLINWLKILSRLGKQLLQDRGIWGVYSSIVQQNLAELALVQVKGYRVPAAHPHPEIPKVPPPGMHIPSISIVPRSPPKIISGFTNVKVVIFNQMILHALIKLFPRTHS